MIAFTENRGAVPWNGGALRRGAVLLRGASLALLAAGVFALVPAAAHAQNAGGEPYILTLEEARERALRQNPEIRRQANSLELESLNVRAAWRTLLPSPELTLLSSNLNWNLQRVANDIFGNPVENPEARMVQSAQTRQSFRLNMNVDLRNYLSLRQEQDNYSVAADAVATRVDALRGSVTLEFLSVQERQLALDLNERLLEEAIRNQEAAERLYSLAQADRLAVLNADLTVADRENQVERSRADLANAYLSLRNLIGDPSLENFRIAPAPLRDVAPASLDVERIVAVALASNPEIRQQENSLRAAERTAGRAWMQWLPQIGVNLSTSRAEASRDGAGAFLSVRPEGGWERSVGISISIPNLGNYFSYQESSRRQQITKANQSETVRETRMRIEQQVRSQVVALQLAHRTVEIAVERERVAAEALEIALGSYRLGGGSFQELQNALEQSAQTQRQALESRHALERALIDLERSLGVPLAEAGISTTSGE